jgi:hypothetical protein
MCSGCKATYLWKIYVKICQKGEKLKLLHQFPKFFLSFRIFELLKYSYFKKALYYTKNKILQFLELSLNIHEFFL